MKRAIFGFHLIEILITLAIISVMSHWVLANYQHFTAETRRREAVNSLFVLASALEQYALANSQYRGATLRKLNMQRSIAGGTYDLQIDNAQENTYQISAHPLQRQAEMDKRCGVLLLTSEGERRVTGTSNATTCW